MSLEEWMTTYKRADGGPIDEHDWVTDLEYLAEDDYPVEVEEEVWERRTTKTFWHLPTRLYACEQVSNPGHLDEDPCGDDAVAWWRDPDTGEWLQVCEEHEAKGSVRP